MTVKMRQGNNMHTPCNANHYAYTYSVRGEAEAEELSRLEQELMRDPDVFRTPSAR